MEERIVKLEQALDLLHKEVTGIRELLISGFKKVDINFESITKEVFIVNKKIEIVNKNVEMLKGSTTEGFDNVGMKLENLTDEISKIGEVTQYDQLYNNLKSIKN